MLISEKFGGAAGMNAPLGPVLQGLYFIPVLRRGPDGLLFPSGMRVCVVGDTLYEFVGSNASDGGRAERFDFESRRHDCVETSVSVGNHYREPPPGRVDIRGPMYGWGAPFDGCRKVTLWQNERDMFSAVSFFDLAGIDVEYLAKGTA